MDECSGLQGMAVPLAREATLRDSSQFVIDDWHQGVSS